MSASNNHRRRSHSANFGGITAWAVAGLFITISAGIGFYFVSSPNSQVESIEPIMANVEVGEFVSQVLDQGEIQSSENVEIRCEVRARNGALTVLSVVPEGTFVQSGDFLVLLDSTSFEKELEQQYISLAAAETGLIQSESTLATAEATKQEYLQGTFPQNQKTIQNEIFDAKSQIETASQELSQAKAALAHSAKLQAKGFITSQKYEADDFAVKKAQINYEKGELSLQLAMQKLDVLQNITRKKELVQLDADIKSARVKLESDRKALEVEKAKLAEIQSVIERCTIRVPEGVSGQVVYAKESSRGRNDWVLEEGASARQNQVLIRLPNPKKMEVKALVNEQSITQIQPDMPVSIKVDALNGAPLKGVVTKVNQYAESGGWTTTIRKYGVYVEILDPPPALKPGMNASVAIQVQFEKDALVAPIQTVYGVQSRAFCLAKQNGRWETIEVEVGGNNSQSVFFKSGVEPGTELVMNPGAYKEMMELPEIQLDSRIEISQEAVDRVKKSNKKNRIAKSSKGKSKPKSTSANSGKSISGSAMIAAKDADGDGRLSKTEVGKPYSHFFGQIDTDSDGLLTETEIETFAKSNKRGGGGIQRGVGDK